MFPLGTFGQELFAKKHGLVRGREEYERFHDVPGWQFNRKKLA